MEQQENTHEISVTWRGKKFVVEMNAGDTLEEFGGKLHELTQVKADTMRLIVKARKASKLLSPFSDEHSRLTLQETSIIEGRSIQMMGVPKDELDQVLRNANTDFRIAGFDEEEKRMRQKMASGTSASVKLPQGPYIFGDFRTLDLPGIELNPPASEALRLMHTLAADAGIVAIMNKHRWRVGIMTEMAPEGYVGVSPVCILGFNKNQGEEISLRLRTDDLKGFRKYQSIKKTLLHELAHMVHSEHDADFYALDKQLNQEAATLDWTRSRGHTLNGAKQSQYYEGEFHVNSSSSLSHKLGGKATSDLLAANARASSVAAAYQRLANAVSDLSTPSQMHEGYREPDPDDHDSWNKFEPDPDDSMEGEAMESESYREPDPDDSEMAQSLPSPEVTGRMLAEIDSREEPDPDDMENLVKNLDEPDPDDSQTGSVSRVEPVPNDSQTGSDSRVEPDPDDSMVLHGQELQRIQDPVVDACNRLQKAIKMLQAEVGPSQAAAVIQTLFKIVRNVIEHPDDMKFKKLRKANPVIQRNIASYKAAMEILFLIGFSEDVVLDEIGKAEAYLVLKRNDPGLLWLAKSSLEMCIAF